MKIIQKYYFKLFILILIHIMEKEDKTLIVHENIKTMFQHRGYTDIDDTDPNYITGISLVKQTVYAFKEIFTDLNIKTINEIISTLDTLDKNHTKHCLIVYTNNCTSAVYKAVLPTSANININIEMFQQLDLLFLCVNHDLVPLHRKLSPPDALEFKKKYSVLGTNGKMKLKIQTMFSSDPISKFYDFRPGDIILVERKNELPGFRLVIASRK